MAEIIRMPEEVTSRTWKEQYNARGASGTGV
jgi:hypothetical protein